MSAKRYTDEFKIEAVRQIVEYGRPVAEVAERLGVSVHSLYGWRRQQGKSAVVHRVESDQNAEVRRLKAELRRVTEERDILKKAAAYFAKGKGEVRLHEAARRRVRTGGHVPRVASASQRLLRVASRADQCSRARRSTLAGLDQAQLAGQRIHLLSTVAPIKPTLASA